MRLKAYFNIIKLLIIVFIFSSQIFAQTSIRDLKSINAELDKFKAELAGPAIAKTSLTLDIEDTILDAEKTLDGVTIAADTIILDGKDFYFGYDYFKKEIDFFDNVPIPSNYILGPGDEIVISLWGEMNSRESFLINKNGQIFYEGVGFINISNRTILKAEEILSRELGKIYSTLQKNKQSTELAIELGRLKSLNIYFSGLVVNPGINLIHPFSDPFSALIQVGGIKKSGSLRNIEILRNGSLIETIDFYDFFNNGVNTFSKVKLVDGDTIHVSVVKNRVKISGEVNRGGYYELLSNESLKDLVNHASGFTSKASSNLILDQIIPVNQRSSDDNARSSMNINFKNAKLVTLNNGDLVHVLSIGHVNSKVEVLGRVKNPGQYSATGSSLKDILDIAGGFNDPIFRKTIRTNNIFVLRRDENDFYAKEFEIKYSESDNFELEINDKILVYENVNYKNSFTYSIQGEVNNPGTYSFSDPKMTLAEAIELAGGLTEIASDKAVTVQQEYTAVDTGGNIITTYKPVKNVKTDFIIGINSMIEILPVENVVLLEGNIYNPGLVAYKKQLRYPRYIELAGGYKPNTLKRNVYIKRANGNIEKARSWLLSSGKKIYPGDTIIVPVDPEPSDFDITAFIADISTTLANLAAIIIIIDRN